MHNANEGLVVVGMVIVVWGAFTYFGIGFSRQTVIDKFARNYEILDENGLLKHDLMFRFLLGISAIIVGIIEHFHASLPITITLLVIAFVLLLRWEKTKRSEFLKPKEPKKDKN